MAEISISLNEKGIPKKFIITGKTGHERRSAFNFTERIRRMWVNEIFEALEAKLQVKRPHKLR